LLAVLAATVVFIVMDDTTEEEAAVGKHKQAATEQSETPSRDRASAKGGSEPVEDLRLDFLVREKSKIEATNPFSPSSWYRAPPPRPKAPPPPPPAPYVAPAPTAPPLPFKYFGSYEDGPKRILLLLKGEQIYPVVEGDTIDDIYLVQKVVGSKIEIVYLPLNMTQTIDTGVNTFTTVK
jgi:hypothetical protein